MTQTFRHNRYKQYRGTFFIFPSLIPLIEILPWLLTLVGSAAGGIVVIRAFLKQHYRKVLLFGVLTLSILGTGGLFIMAHANHQFENAGSQLVAESDWSNLETKTALPPYSFPAPPYLWDGQELQNVWTVRSRETLLSTPILTDEIMLIGTFKNTLQARALKDGSLLWTLKKNNPIYSPPKVVQDKIYVGEGLHMAANSKLSALSYPDGTVLWEREFPSHLESYPVMDEKNKHLWIAGGATGLWCLNADTGTKLWWAQIGHIDSAPLYKNRRLFTAAKLKEDEDGSAFFELSPENGKILWSIPLEGNPISDTQDLGDDQLLIATAYGQIGLNKATDNGWVYGIDLDKPNKIKWKTKLSTMPMPDGQLSKDRKTIYYALKNGQIWALNTKNGDVLWIKKYGNEYKSNLALYEEGEKAFLIAHEAQTGHVHILEAQTGETIKTLDFKCGSYVAPIYKNGMLYITTPYDIYAYRIGR